MARILILALVAAGLGVPVAATAEAAGAEPPASSIGDSRAPPQGFARPVPVPPRAVAAEPARANFGREAASGDVHRVADWVAASGDNHGLPFMIVDKVDARVLLFDGRSRVLGAAPALLGLGHGDDSVPGIGQRRLATIAPSERTTPAGRFEASLGNDLEQEVLWIDYDAALSLHRVIVGNPADHRHERLASATPLDNRISYGCINVPASFFDRIVVPAFRGTVGIVYILPETKTFGDVFATGNDSRLPQQAQPARHRRDSGAGTDRRRRDRRAQQSQPAGRRRMRRRRLPHGLEQRGEEGHGIAQIIGCGARKPNAEPIGLLFALPHLGGARARQSQPPKRRAGDRKPPAVMKKVVRELVRDHQGESAVGAALRDDAVTDHHPLAVRPGVDRLAGDQLDVGGTAEIGSETQVTQRPCPGDAKAHLALRHLLGQYLPDALHRCARRRRVRRRSR
jgi:hypothetical protein